MPPSESNEPGPRRKRSPGACGGAPRPQHRQPAGGVERSLDSTARASRGSLTAHHKGAHHNGGNYRTPVPRSSPDARSVTQAPRTTPVRGQHQKLISVERHHVVSASSLPILASIASRPSEATTFLLPAHLLRPHERCLASHVTPSVNTVNANGTVRRSSTLRSVPGLRHDGPPPLHRDQATRQTARNSLADAQPPARGQNPPSARKR